MNKQTFTAASTVSYWDYTMSDDGMIGKWWIAKDLEVVVAKSTYE
jgi:hypothetical protein